MALTDKQAVFVDEYLKCYNATQAALSAGYSPKTARSIGAENLTKPDISEVISQRLRESAMSADEVLQRLASHARGSMGDFVKITPAGPQFDFEAASLADQLHLVKKLKTKTRTSVLLGKEDNEDSSLITEVEVEFELYDAQSALEKLGRHHKLFTDKNELSGTVGTVQMPFSEWEKRTESVMTKVSKTMNDFEDE